MQTFVVQNKWQTFLKCLQQSVKEKKANALFEAVKESDTLKTESPLTF